MPPTAVADLDRLFAGLPATVLGRAQPVTSLATDSRRVRPGALFFCLRGARSDGHAFAADAVRAGAVAVVADHVLRDVAAPQVIVPDPLAALSKIAARFFGEPAAHMTMVGVTGTNGKTTTTFFIEAMARAAGRPWGLVGTLGAFWRGRRVHELENTTPFPHELQSLLADFREQGAAGAVLEVSSHALALHRVDDVGFDVAVLTNLTHDHLDFHGSLEAYRAAKKRLFSAAYGKHAVPAVAVVNADDAWGRELAADIRSAPKSRCLTYGLADTGATLVARDVTLTPQGAQFSVPALRPVPFRIALPGAFNVANALAALACGVALDWDVEDMAEGLESVTGVPGRMVRLEAGGVCVYVDYAHTPDGLEKVLTAVRELTRGRILCVFGCGGDRDAAKRPIMGRVAALLADYAILTTDNPRTEDPDRIARDVLAGMPADAGRGEYVADRAAAIARAIQLAQPGDAVVIAGKGHEEYQIIGTEHRPFSDHNVARTALQARYGTCT